MSQCRNLGSACPEPPGEQQLRSMKAAIQSLSISISAVLRFIALMVLFFCALLAACWPPRRRISGATTSKSADIQWNPPDLPSELCDSALQEKKVMLDSGCHAAFTMIFARSTSMSSKDVHLNGHLPLSGLSVFVMEGPSSSEDYVNSGVEERVGRRIINFGRAQILE